MDALADAEITPLWWAGLPPTPDRPALEGRIEADVAIVGAGYTGLWTALHLLERDPGQSVVVLEREHAAFGASGRNGGWCMGETAIGFDTLVRRGGVDAASAMRRELFETVPTIGRTASDLGIDCHFEHGGQVTLARNAAQKVRLRRSVDEDHESGLSSDDVRFLDADEARTMVGATGVQGAAFSAHTAVIQPARLAVGLAEAVEAAGGRIHESTEVTDVAPGRVTTSRGTVTAGSVVIATEGYTRDLPGRRRDLVPLYSLMIATEPLSADRWGSLGMDARPAFADARYAVVYGQRTADDRLAFGGRISPYRFGSTIDSATETDLDSHRRVHETLLELFPDLADVAITHRWGGVFGTPRNWQPFVTHDPATGLARAGGYVGEGVGATHLAGATLADLILGLDTPRTKYPWVGSPSRRWEPEPLRWTGVRLGRALFERADRTEARTGSPSRLPDAVWGLFRR